MSRVLSCGLLASLCASCVAGESPTAVLLQLEVEPQVEADLQMARLVIVNDVGEQVLDRTLDPGPWPQTALLVPEGGDASRRFRAVFEGVGAAGWMTSDSVEGGFTSGQVVTMPLVLPWPHGSERARDGGAPGPSPDPDASTPDASGGIDGGGQPSGPDASDPDDAAAEEGGMPAPQSDCDDTYPAAIASQNFEGSTTAGWNYFSVSDSSFSRCGSSSMFSEIDAETRQSYVQLPFAARSSGQLHFRGYFFIPDSVELVALNFVELAGPSSQGIDFNLAESDTPGFFAHTGQVERFGEAGDIPRGRWFCAQMEVRLGETDGSVRWWIDRKQVLSVTNLDTIPDGGLSNLRAGIEWAAQENAALFLDELVLDTTKVPCLTAMP